MGLRKLRQHLNVHQENSDQLNITKYKRLIDLHIKTFGETH